MKKKLAFSGKANSGKSTISDMIIDRIKDFNIANFAFADPIKRIAQIMYPNINDEILWGPSALRSSLIEDAIDSCGLPLTCRQMLLDIGKMGRGYNPNTWIDATILEVNKFVETTNNVAVISDVRFKNELFSLKENGFFVTRIIRKTTSIVTNDISEIDLDDVPLSSYDYVIFNDKDLDLLEQKVRELTAILLV